MAFENQPAFSTDVLTLPLDRKVFPFAGVKRFDLRESINQCEDDFFPLLRRPVQILDARGTFEIYTHLPGNDPLLKHPYGRDEIRRFRRRKKWNNDSLPIPGVNMSLMMTVTSQEQARRLEDYYLEVSFGSNYYALSCLDVDEEDLRDAMRELGSLVIPNVQLVDTDDNPVWNPFPANPHALSLIDLTLREYDSDEEDEGDPEILPDPSPLTIMRNRSLVRV